MTDLPVSQNRKNLESRTTQFLFDFFVVTGLQI